MIIRTIELSAQQEKDLRAGKTIQMPYTIKKYRMVDIKKVYHDTLGFETLHLIETN